MICCGGVSGIQIVMMQRILRFNFSRTVALISGAPKHDRYVREISATLKDIASGQNDLKIVGAISDEFSQNFDDIYASSKLLDNYEFEVTRAYNSYHEDIQDTRVMPYRIYTHWRNHQFVKELQASNFFKDIFEKKVQSVATVGNFSLSLRIGEKLNEYSQKLGVPRPFTALFHRQISERTVENEEFIDYQYYNIEKALSNSSGYIFPSYCVGYTGLYKMFQHLQQYKPNREYESDLFNYENFSWEISELVKKSRSKFRAARGISEDKYIIYLEAGDDVDKINFSFKGFKNGLAQFLEKDQIKSISRDHFEIFVRIPAEEKLANEIKGKLGYLPSNIKVTLIEEADKYAAIAASDFGIIHNGEQTVVAASAQLPSVVLDNMTNFHAYFNNLYNGHVSPLNIATNQQGYEEICGSLTLNSNKLGDSLLRHFLTPKLRYYYAKLYRDQIQKIISKSGTNPHLRVGASGFDLGCRHFLSRGLKLDRLGNSTSLPTYKRVSLRKEVFNND